MANSKPAWPLWTAALTLALGASLGYTQSTQAADIAVDAGGTCTLAEAITSANNDNAVGNGCVDGSGADTITLQTDVSLTASLPDVTTTITIEGGGHTVDGNNDLAVGSVFRNAGGSLTINNATVSGGNSPTSGGGIHNYQGNLSLNNTTVSGNSAAELGGGIFNHYGSCVISNSTLSGNTAYSWGGAIENWGSSLTLTNSTVSGNVLTGGGGGGIDNWESTLTVNNSTLTGNLASENGGGIYNYAAYYSATTTLHNSLISGNSAAGGNELYSAYDGTAIATVIVDGFNVFAHGGETDAAAFQGFVPGASDINASSDGTSVALASILETTLADNGGSTRTHALVAGSPALDLDLTCTLAEDQRQYPRPFGAGCDAGSFEYGSTLPCGAGRYLPANTWLMTAPSCSLSPAGIVAQLGDDLPGVYGTNWISFKWDADVQDYGAPQSGDDLLIPGAGNWHYSTGGGTMVLAGVETNVTTCPGSMSPFIECFEIPLTVDGNGTTRWNLVGHPFPADVSWADVRISAGINFYTPSEAEAAGIVSKSFYSWNGNAYQAYDDATAGMMGTLQSQHSIWVRTLPTTEALLAYDIASISLWIPKPL